MIESFAEGRIRLRSILFRNKDTHELLHTILRNIEGVSTITFNIKTNSILIEYDPKRIPLAIIMNAVPLFKRMESLEKLPAAEGWCHLKVLLEEFRVLFSQN